MRTPATPTTLSPDSPTGQTTSAATGPATSTAKPASHEPDHRSANVSVSRRRLARWARQEPALGGLAHVAELRTVLLDRTAAYDRKDDLLAALVRLSRTDTDAGLVLVTCLLPGLRSKLARYGHSLDTDEAASVIVAGLWERIRRYNLDRRPRRIANNLLWDATHKLLDMINIERAWAQRTTVLTRSDCVADGPDISSGAIWAAAIRAGVLTSVDVTLIDATRLGGLSLADTARLLGISYEAAKKRRQRAEATWATWWVFGEEPRAA